MSLLGCQPNAQRAARAPAVDTSAVLVIIDSMRALYEDAVATGDFETMGTLLAEETVMIGPGGPAWDSLRAASDYPWPPGTTLAITPIETVVLSDAWAYDFGTSTATYTPEGAAEPRTLRDTYLLLLRKTDGGWKVYRDIAPHAHGGSVVGDHSMLSSLGRLDRCYRWLVHYLVASHSSWPSCWRDSRHRPQPRQPRGVHSVDRTWACRSAQSTPTP